MNDEKKLGMMISELIKLFGHTSVTGHIVKALLEDKMVISVAALCGDDENDGIVLAQFDLEQLEMHPKMFAKIAHVKLQEGIKLALKKKKDGDVVE